MKNTLKISIGLFQLTLLTIIGFGYSAVLHAEHLIQKTAQNFIGFEESIYSDVVAGSIELTPIIELVFMADVNCYEHLNSETTDFQLSPNEKVEIDVETSIKKTPYSVSLEEVEKEAEILSLETGFFHPSFLLHEPISAIETTSEPLTGTTEESKNTLLEESMSTMIKNLVFQGSGNDRCSVDNLNIHLINTLNIKSL